AALHDLTRHTGSKQRHHGNHAGAKKYQDHGADELGYQLGKKTRFHVMVDFNINEKPKVRAGLLRNTDFLKLWTGQTISEIGSRITRDGLPLAAVIVLGAQPSQMGFIMAVGTACTLVFGLLAGVWVDRMKRRPI